MQGGTFTISQPGRHRRHLLHADHQRARSRDHGRVPLVLEAGVARRQDVGVALHAAAVAVVGPSRDRRRVRGALQQPLRRVCSPTCGASSSDGDEHVMANTIEVKVPDIGDFKDVPVIEVLVKPGDAVKAEDSLVTLESDKATMDVPSPVAGVVKELKVKVGDKVSEGSADPDRRGGRRGARRRPRQPHRRARRRRKPRPGGRRAGSPLRAAPRRQRHRRRRRRRTAARPTSNARCSCWAPAPAATRAAFRSADLGMKTVLVERYRDAGRRVPQRRLHSVQGAAAHGGGDGRGRRARRARHRLRRAADRPAQAARRSRTAWSRS